MFKKRIFIYVLIIFGMLAFFQFDNVFASESDDNSFVVLDENGNPKRIEINNSANEEDVDTYSVISKDEDNKKITKTFDTYQGALNQYKKSVQNNDTVSLLADDMVRASTANYTNHIVRFKTVAELNGKTVTYTEMDTKREGYFNTNSSNDAAYISTDSKGNVICKLGGVVMSVPASCVKEIVPYTSGNISYYYVNDGKLLHYYSYIGTGNKITMSSTRVGYKPDYLETGKKYYSYDGHYFYSSFENMIKDYKNYASETYSNAVNKNNPYYNYYQYLSLRSTTSITASQFNSRINNLKGSSSKMYNKGQSFINAQNTYGINASLMFGIACNESSYGTSSIALNKNNLFGLNAVDSSPTETANYFSSVDQCINEFAYNYISQGYLDGNDSRYRGPHLGDKRSGLNVKYASDPYWGEKAAAQTYYLEGVSSDYQKYNIGISNQTVLSLYKESNTSKRIYTSSVNDKNGISLYNYPVIILGYTTDSSGVKWYKVQSDMPLQADRSARNVNAKYDYSRDYVYTKSSLVDLNNGTVKALKSFSKITISGVKSSYTYTGSQIKPSIVVKDGNTTLKNGTNYIITYSNNTNVGTATIKISGIGNYTGTLTKTFKITKSTYTPTTKAYSGTYDGKSHTFTLSGVKSGSTIKYSTDGKKTWTTTKPTRTSYGTTTVYYQITNDNYKDITGSSTITIKKATYKPTIKAYSGTYDGKAHTITISGVKSGSTIKYRTSEKASWSTTKPTRTSAGTTTVYYQITNPNYNTITGSQKITIAKRNVSTLTYSKLSNKTYTGKQIKYAPTVKYGSKTLKSGTDYTLSYGTNKNTGKATVKITGKGNYTGSITKTFYIVPKTPSSLKVTAGKKSAKVSYKKSTGASGYQIAYSTSKTNGYKYVTTTSLTKTLSKLTSKKTYYIKVRAYKTVGKTKYYGSYSSIKSIKIK